MVGVVRFPPGASLDNVYRICIITDMDNLLLPLPVNASDFLVSLSRDGKTIEVDPGAHRWVSGMTDQIFLHESQQSAKFRAKLNNNAVNAAWELSYCERAARGWRTWG